jgi:hypothetical protein
MAAPLCVCTEGEQHSGFCGQMCQELQSKSQNSEIVQVLCIRKEPVHPSMATNKDSTELAHDMVLLRRQVTIDEVANRLKISHCSV